MNPPRSKQLNLLALPPTQRQLLLYLMRNGATEGALLPQALRLDAAEVEKALTALKAQGAIEEHDGHLQIQLGRTRPRRLPARLWPALQSANRPYTTQEIVALRTVVPILQFARARMGEFTDHGPGHVLRVKSFATQLGYAMGLTEHEHRLLRAAAFFHDVGNVIDRGRHHIISQETVEALTARGDLPYSNREAALIGLLCRWHRKEYDPNHSDELYGETIRTGLLASILRVADALDSDYRRVDYGEKFKRVLEIFYPQEMPFLQDLDQILGIRICCTPQVQLQVFVHATIDVEKSYHIRALRKDVADTPLDYAIRVIKCGPTGTVSAPASRPNGQLPQRTLLVSPFDPHSLIMSALSRKQLLAAGYPVDLLIYPDTPDAASWLWGEAITERNPNEFSHLVLIGDRPDPTLSLALAEQVARWQVAGSKISFLNRHEANWTRLTDLQRKTLANALSMTFGGDWAYFWGDDVDETDLFWGRVAALCTRDPIQSTVSATIEEQTISQGVLKLVYDGLTSATHKALSEEEWAALATPILEQITLDNRVWFADAAATFHCHYATLPQAVTVMGKVLRFDLAAVNAPHTIFWGLEAAIEEQGRKLVRGICFNTPYAIATWQSPGINSTEKEMIELLAISHWREEDAIPIRILFPTDWTVTPEGNECALRLRLPADQAAQLVELLVAACNQT
ncbi:MAG: HD domain-containing protein [Caldilineaceae bacterium]